MAAPKSTKKKKAKKPENSEQRKARLRKQSFENANRAIFKSAGFKRVPRVDGRHFEFKGIKSELDDIFIMENVVLLVEYTTATGSNLASHVKGKSGSHGKISSDYFGFLTEFAKISSGVKDALDSLLYTKNQLMFRMIYCSDESVEPHHQAFMANTKFISRAERMYFRKLVQTIKKSARFELLDFLGLDPLKVGSSGVIPTGSKSDKYHGSLLPEEHSNFPPGFKIASFYVDPEAILKRAYVLRQGGWKDSLNLYQRMIIPGKINAIRRYLRDQHRVFANNVVLTLPDDTEFRDEAGKLIDPLKISETTATQIIIGDRPNSIGIIDGQHRVFSYYEDLNPDPLIDKFRSQQNLLATGIVYPQGKTPTEKEQFEAALFLEINSNQSGARSDLKQAIWLILDPFKPISVARTVVNGLAATSPLAGVLERNSYDVGRLRTTTIVTYGIQPLVKRSGGDSLFSIWNDPDKAKLSSGSKDVTLLQRYISFSVSHISQFLNDIRSAIDGKKWAIAEKGGSGVLSVTTINSFVILMRRLIETGHIDSKGIDPSVEAALGHIDGLDFGKYRSSQYAALATEMYKIIT